MAAPNQDTYAIQNEVYPLVQKSLEKNMTKYKAMLSRFIEKRSAKLYDTCPCDRIAYGKEDEDDLFNSLGIDYNDVVTAISHTYYYSIPNFNPRSAKGPVTVLGLCIIKYFIDKKDKQNTALACTYFSFTGQMYPSIHRGSFPIEPTQYRHVMEYVINNNLNAKFNIRSEGSVVGAVRSICNTWVDTYDKLFAGKMSDYDAVYLIQQLHTRIKSFLINIASEYYAAYKNKDQYITYDSDNLDSQDNYRIADNDALRAENTAGKAFNYLTTHDIDYRFCKTAADANVKTDEIKSIMQSVLDNKDNIDILMELIRIIIGSYYEQSKTKDVRDISFITFSIRAKPNTKNKNILRQREIVEKLLDENSPAYRKRKSRIVTKISYNKAILTYIVLIIHEANK